MIFDICLGCTGLMRNGCQIISCRCRCNAQFTMNWCWMCHGRQLHTIISSCERMDGRPQHTINKIYSIFSSPPKPLIFPHSANAYPIHSSICFRNTFKVGKYFYAWNWFSAHGPLPAHCPSIPICRLPVCDDSYARVFIYLFAVCSIMKCILLIFQHFTITLYDTSSGKWMNIIYSNLISFIQSTVIAVNIPMKIEWKLNG